jgi:pimeloyl-ACP methyl ester carboxylesterase
MARIRELTPWLEEAKILIPAMFAYGDAEPAAHRTKDFDKSLSRAPLDEQDDYFMDLIGKVCIEDAGHWPMVEQPEQVNRILLDFLHRVSPVT